MFGRKSEERSEVIFYNGPSVSYRKKIKFRNKSFLAERNLLAERTYFLGSIPQRDSKLRVLVEDY